VLTVLIGLNEEPTDRFEDGHGLLAEPDGEEDVVVEDGLKQVVFVVGFEWRLTRHHLVHQHPQGPPVHRRAVIQLLKDLVARSK